MNLHSSSSWLRILAVLAACGLGQFLFASVARAQEAPPPEMCGDGTTFTVDLPGTASLPRGVKAPDDSVTLPNGCRIYALLVSGYERNASLDELTFYKLTKFVAENNGYVHWAWWNNLLKEYMALPLHDVQVDVPVLGTIGTNPGGLGGVHGLGFVPKNFGEVTAFVPKAVPEEDFQFQADAELFLKAIRANNPNAIIIVAGHSMGGDSVVRLGTNPNVSIDLLAPIDPVGNRSRPVGRVPIPGLPLRQTFNWNRWRVANTLLGYRQRDCVRNALGLCRDFDPRPFRVSFQCTEGPLLDAPPLFGSRAPLVCPQLVPIVVTGPRPTIGANVRFLYHRWQKEFVFPFDFGADEPLTRGSVTDILGGNFQAPVPKNALGESNPNKTCGAAGNIDVGLLAFQVLGISFTLPEFGVQPGDPRDPNIFCVPLDGHGEIVGFRRIGIEPIALQAQGNWPIFDRAQGINDAQARRQKLIEMTTAPSPDPNKTINDPPNWAHEPKNPNLDLVVDDMIAIVQHLLSQQQPEDVTPPVTVATANPAANANGWNMDDVVVDLTATDTGGSGVKEVETSLTGAQLGGMLTPGNTAQETITAEGTTTITFFARDNAANVEAPNTSTVKLDKTPPSVEAVPSPAPNAFGWNNSDVTVTFSASDALAGLAEVSPMDPVLVTTEGADQEIIGTATDLADNQSAAAALVSLDKTLPALNGAADRAPDSNGWYNRRLTVTWDCTDGLSGVQSFSATSDYNGPDSASALVSGRCFDFAENEASATVKFQFDATPPTIVATLNPLPNANGWHNTDVTVTFTAVDALSGVNLVSNPVLVTSEGAGQVVTGTAIDLAGNSSFVTVTLNIDKTAPEAFNQFDAVGLEVAVFGRDSLSGVAPGALTPIAVVAVPEEQEDDEHDRNEDGEAEENENDEDDEDEMTELRTYKVLDLAGNVLLLVERVEKEGHQIKARVLTLQYNNGAVLTLPRNRKKLEWALEKDGTLKALEQKLEVRTQEERQRLEAKFSLRENETAIRQKDPEPEFRVVRPGLVLLRMATHQGNLVLEF